MTWQSLSTKMATARKSKGQ